MLLPSSRTGGPYLNNQKIGCPFMARSHHDMSGPSCEARSAFLIPQRYRRVLLHSKWDAAIPPSVCSTYNYFSRFQPRNRMSSHKTTRKPDNQHITNEINLPAKVNFSYIQPAILKTEEKNKQAPPGYIHPLGLSHLERIFWTQVFRYEYFAAIDLP